MKERTAASRVKVTYTEPILQHSTYGNESRAMFKMATGTFVEMNEEFMVILQDTATRLHIPRNRIALIEETKSKGEFTVTF